MICGLHYFHTFKEKERVISKCFTADTFISAQVSSAARGGTISIIFIEPHSASLTSLWQSQSEKPDTRHIDFPSPAAKIYLGLRSGVPHNPSCLFATRICACILCLFMASLVFLPFFWQNIYIFLAKISPTIWGMPVGFSTSNIFIKSFIESLLWIILF